MEIQRGDLQHRMMQCKLGSGQLLLSHQYLVLLDMTWDIRQLHTYQILPDVPCSRGTHESFACTPPSP